MPPPDPFDPYGVPDPSEYMSPGGPWSSVYRDVGGMTAQDFLRPPEMPYTGYEEAAPMEEPQQFMSEADFVDWPSYQGMVGKNLPPQDAYDKYINILLPAQLRQMGYSDDDARAEIEVFASQVPPPPGDYGVLGNLWESLTGGFSAGKRGVAAAGYDVAGEVDDVARLAVEQAANAPTAPRIAFDEARRTGGTSNYESVKAFLSAAVKQPEGFFNEGIYQIGQSAPVIAAGLGGLLIPSPGAAPAAAGASSFALDTGATLLGDIVDMAQTRGVDINNAQAVEAMLREPDVYAQLREQAAAHGFGVGATDAALAAISFGIGGAAAKMIRAGRPLRAGATVAGGLGATSVGGGLGEALGTELAGKPYSADDVVAEALLGFSSDVAFEGAGLARGLRNRPVAPAIPPVVDEGGLGEGDLGVNLVEPEGPPGAPPNVLRGRAPPTYEVQEPGFTPSVLSGRGVPPTIGVEEISAEEADAVLEMAEFRRLLELDQTAETIDIEPPDDGPPGGGIGVTEGPPLGPVETFTLSPIVDRAEAAIAEGRLLPQIARPGPSVLQQGPAGVGTPEQMEQLRIQGLTTPQSAELNLRDRDNVMQWLRDRGVTIRSQEQMDVVDTVLNVPATTRQAAIADMIDGLASSTEQGAEPLAQALMAISRSIPKDRVTPAQAAAALKAALPGIPPNEIVHIATSAVAQKVMDDIAAGVVDVATQPSTPTTAPLTAGPTVTRRGLRSGEPIPSAGLGALAGQLTGAGPGGGVAPSVQQPRGGLRNRVNQEGTGGRQPGRSLGRTTTRTAGAGALGAGAQPVGDAGAPRIQVKLAGAPAQETPGQPRRIAGRLYGAQAEDVANAEVERSERDLAVARKVTGGLGKKAKAGVKAKLKPVLEAAPVAETPEVGRKRNIDLVVMTEAEYNKAYPGRNYQEDVDEIAKATNVTPDEGALFEAGTSNALNEAPMSPAVLRTLAMSPFSSVMDYLAAVMPSPLQRLVAQQIERLDLRVPITLQNLPPNERGEIVKGYFQGNLEGGRIVIDPRNGTLKSVLHEAVHAATAATMRDPKNASQQAAAKAMVELYEYTKRALPNSEAYGLRNVDEFVAEALSNTQFQKELQNLPLPNGSRYDLKSAWDLFKRLVMRLLGLNKSDNVLSEALLTASDLFDNRAFTTPALLSDTGKPPSQGSPPASSGRKNAVPSHAILGTKNGARTHVAYLKKGSSDNYTLYPVDDQNYRGNPEGKLTGMSRAEVEKYIRGKGSDVIAPAADGAIKTGVPTNSATRLVGYGTDGTLHGAAFEQKDGSWTYYESDADVRSDTDARVHKGLSKDAVQRSIAGRGFLTEPPKNGAIKPSTDTNTTIGYKPTGWFRREFQDLEATLKEIKDPELDAAATLRNGRYWNALDKAKKQYVEPARKAGEEISKRYGKTQDEIMALMQAMHVAERMPVKIRQFHRGNMSPAEVAAKEQELLTKQRKAEKDVQDARNSNAPYVQAVRQELSPKIKAMSDNTIDLQAQYGLISRDTAETIKRTYDFYVPLQTGDKTTIGKAATGATVEGDRTFARMVDQLQHTIARGEQNRVRQRVLELVEQARLINLDTKESPITVDSTPVIRYDVLTNSLNMGEDSHIFDRNSVDVFVDGARRRMVVHDESLLDALHPFKDAQRKTAITTLGAAWSRVMQIISIGKTSLNPAWPPFNFARDWMTANLNMPTGVSRARYNKEILNPVNWASVLWNVAGEAFGREPTGTYADAKAASSFITHRAFLGLDPTAADVQTMFRPSIGSKAKQGANWAIYDFLSILAQAAESIPRMAVYKAAVDSGLTKEQAAVAAKNASVNFELRGRRNLSRWWIFGNAKMQGVHAMIKTLERNGTVWSGVGLLGIVSLGAIAAGLGYEWSEKDKDGKSKYAKIPDYKKDSMLLFKADALGMPIPQEIAPAYVLGNAVVEALMGGTSNAKAGARIFTSFLNNLYPGSVAQEDPIGHKANAMDFMLRMFVPSLLAPMYDTGTNKNTFGTAVVSGKEQKQKQGIPMSQMGNPDEEQLAVNLRKNGYLSEGVNKLVTAAPTLAAQGIYSATGGAIDMAPQQIKLWHNYFDPLTEGYAFWRDMLGGRESKYVGDIVNPLQRKFSGPAMEFHDQEQFDELLSKANRARFLAEKPGGGGIDALSPEDQVLARSAKMLAKKEADGKNLFKGDKLMTKERRALLNERKREYMLDGIRQYNELRDRTIPKR